MEKLSKAEIQKRLIKLRNYEVLYPRLKAKYVKLKARVKFLEAELARERRERVEIVEMLKLQIEELRAMVFGKKRGGGDDHEGRGTSGKKPTNPPKNKKPRSPASYRRPTPKDEEVTHETSHGIEDCSNCGEPLVNLREVVRYLEDIVIPALTGGKTVTKQRIETGFCKKCRKWRSSISIRKQICSLGENVRQRIVYCITILGMTFEKVARDLQDTFGITVGDGEMANILTMEAAKLLPEYHHIDARIRSGPCAHLDETGWPVQKGGEGQFGWVKTASDSPDTIFRLGRSRGKGNAKLLLKDPDQPIVTDDYAAYDGLTDQHALCWAHPKRKFRDLAESSTLMDERREHCRQFYEQFKILMKAVKAVVDSPYDVKVRLREAGKFRSTIFELMTPSAGDPNKLATFKATFLENTERYLLRVLKPNIPMTNNKAERSIRPLVIKRKLSFGSKTQKGADVMSILLSVCLSTWWSKPTNFYEAYRAMIRKWKTA